MRIITPGDVAPNVRIANYHSVGPGQSWPNRQIPDLQLILAVKGDYHYLEENNPPVVIHTGSVLCIEPGRRHTFCIASRGEGLISGVHLELTPDGAWAAGDYRLTPTPERVTPVADFAYLHDRFQRLAAVYKSYWPYRTEQTCTIAREIVLVLAGQWQQPSAPTLSPRMAAIIQFIREHLQDPLSRQTLAHRFGITPEHVNVLFRKELGMTPSAVINRERVMAAYRLLNEQACTVKEAAYAVGFSDPLYFSRVFKHIFGVPPSRSR
jgi:AraC-like DNA-binding protein/quercetin dioxygenase-like cupin family protein